MRKGGAKRDLSLIRSSGSTARIINLALVHERYGDTKEYSERPLFRGKQLNRALILKHTLRAHERGLFNTHVTTATKVILPYSSKELGLGGVSAMVGERGFDKFLRDTVGGYEALGDVEADHDLLCMLDALPSFDPFLIRERLRMSGIQPARCYFEIAEADVGRMREYVSREFSKLISMAFGGESAESSGMSRRLAEKLMTDETAQALDPLRATLRLSGDEYIEGVFAWKGFLYYRWMMGDLKPQLAEFSKRFANCRVMRASHEEAHELAAMRKSVMTQMRLAANRVDELLQEYADAFDALTAGEPAAFRLFLLKAPSMFIPIGEAVGVLKHVLSFWSFRFPGNALVALEVDEAIELFGDFAGTLNGVQLSARTSEGEFRIG